VLFLALEPEILTVAALSERSGRVEAVRYLEAEAYGELRKSYRKLDITFRSCKK
jgi:hypothetical protein